MNTKGLIPRLWRKIKRILLILFIAQFAYIILLRWINPPITMTQLVSWISGHGLKRYVSRKNMSPGAKLAIIAAEDQLFPDHNGFDFKSIEKAMKHNQKSKSLRGASTISQQVAKNVFLWQGRSWIRKGLEVYFTFMIELVWNKKENIADVYECSADGRWCIWYRSRCSEIFSEKPASALSRQEAAMIAACLPNPVRYTVKPVSSYVRYRSGWIMRQMNNLDRDADVRIIVYENAGKTK